MNQTGLLIQVSQVAKITCKTVVVAQSNSNTLTNNGKSDTILKSSSSASSSLVISSKAKAILLIKCTIHFGRSQHIQKLMHIIPWLPWVKGEDQLESKKLISISKGNAQNTCLHHHPILSRMLIRVQVHTLVLPLQSQTNQSP